MKAVQSLLVAFVLLLSSFALAGANFPVGPNPTLTPGSLCTSPTSQRYPEHINYCERDVASDLKNQIIQTYDQQLGFHIGSMDRGDFKIDHFIPLSIGGSNESTNLWPQHKSIYGVTDQLEQLLSNKISAGRIKQADAVRVIREAKLNLGRVPDLVHYVNGL